MKTYHYTVQCTERKTGRIGCFVYDDARPFVAISPVFNGLVELYDWMRANGWRSVLNGVWTCERIPKRFKARLMLQSAKEFVRDFDKLIDAQHLCSRVARADNDSFVACGKKDHKFLSFTIEDTVDQVTYTVDDWDDYFGIIWSNPERTDVSAFA